MSKATVSDTDIRFSYTLLSIFWSELEGVCCIFLKKDLRALVIMTMKMTASPMAPMPKGRIAGTGKSLTRVRNKITWRTITRKIPPYRNLLFFMAIPHSRLYADFRPLLLKI